MVAVVLFAVAGAVLSTYLQRYFVIVGSGAVGALMIIHGAIGLAGKQLGVSASSSGVWTVVPFDPAPGQKWVPVAWGLLGLIGIGVQLGWTGGERVASAAASPDPKPNALGRSECWGRSGRVGVSGLAGRVGRSVAASGRVAAGRSTSAARVGVKILPGRSPRAIASRSERKLAWPSR